MRPTVILAILVVLAGVGFVAWRHHVADQAEADAAADNRALQEAGRTMDEHNRVEEAMPGKLKAAFAHVLSVAVISTERAHTVIDEEVLPVIDEYLGKSELAFTAADAYLARHPDPTTSDNIAVLRRRAKAFRDLRTQLATLSLDLAAGKLTLETLGDRVGAMGGALFGP
jgi:hypothetical protein